MKPDIVERPAFHVVGMAGRFTPATIPEIPALWGRFAPVMGIVPGKKGRACYGTCRPDEKGERGTPALEYTACVEVESLKNIPNGMVGFTVPAGRYARFTHQGHIKKIGETFDAIHHEWFPKSGLTRADGYDFEYYDDRWDPATGMGDVDIYVPISGKVATR